MWQADGPRGQLPPPGIPQQTEEKEQIKTYNAPEVGAPAGRDIVRVVASSKFNFESQKHIPSNE